MRTKKETISAYESSPGTWRVMIDGQKIGDARGFRSPAEVLADERNGRLRNRWTPEEIDAAYDFVLPDDDRATFIVNADHVAPEYRAVEKLVTVGRYAQAPGEPELFYAAASPYGCGKNARTREAAIVLLLQDNGCTNIRSRRRS